MRREQVALAPAFSRRDVDGVEAVEHDHREAHRLRNEEQDRKGSVRSLDLRERDEEAVREEPRDDRDEGDERDGAVEAPRVARHDEAEERAEADEAELER